MDRRLIPRLTYWKSTLRGWWFIVTVILAIWGILSNFRDDFLSPELQAKWVIPVLFPRWYWPVIVFLVVTIIAILEGAYRAHVKAIAQQDTLHATEISKLKEGYEKKIIELSTRLDEVNKPDLIFEVEKCPQCSVTLSHEQYTSVLPDTVPQDVDNYVINATVKIHFQNHGLNQLMLTKPMGASLFRITGNGKEKPIPLQQKTALVLGEGSKVLDIDKLDEVRFEPTNKTKSYIITFGMAFLTRYGKRLNQNWGVNYLTRKQWAHKLSFMNGFTLGISFTSS